MIIINFGKHPVCRVPCQRYIWVECLYNTTLSTFEWQKTVLPATKEGSFKYMGIWLFAPHMPWGKFCFQPFCTNYIKKRSICLMWRLYDLFEVFFHVNVNISPSNSNWKKFIWSLSFNASTNCMIFIKTWRHKQDFWQKILR